MLALILAILSSASMALIFRINEGRQGNRYVLTSMNYLTAVIISGSMLGRGPSWLPLSFPLREFGRALGSGSPLDAAASQAWSLLLGPPAGLCLFLGLIFYQKAVRVAGVGLSGAFAKLGILVPMSLSLVLWREWPGLAQAVGIGFALGAIVSVLRPRVDRARDGAAPVLLLLFTCVGLADFSNKLFQIISLPAHKSLFLLASFACALLFSLIPCLVLRKTFSRADLLLGVAVGIPNLLSSYFLISALDHFPAAVTFPVFSAGTIVTLFLCGRLFFGEELDRPKLVALALTLPALVLMNL